MGTRGGRGTPWSEAELAALREGYPEHGAAWDGWGRILPGRTTQAIQQKAKKSGIRGPGHWGADEDAIVALHYGSRPMSWGGWRRLLPGRSRQAIMCRAHVLGAVSARTWTDDDRARLLRSVRSVAAETGHTPLACVRELQNMARRWSA